MELNIHFQYAFAYANAYSLMVPLAQKGVTNAQLQKCN
jgi:hypothetical protein